MNMRRQFVKSVESILGSNEQAVLLLGDIGVWGFRNAFKEFPERVYNIGILEQATASFAAGLSLTNLVPIVHTIAPFLVERCAEQLKDDFCYQRVGGNFVSVGASYDFSPMGCTHHCPGDIAILKTMPGMQIVVPGTSQEFDTLIQECFSNGSPTYYRLSEREHPKNFPVSFGKANINREGKKATVIAVGPALIPVLEAFEYQDVTILYYSTVSPFDRETLKQCANEKILICEPYYEGGILPDVLEAFSDRAIRISCVGVPKKFLTNYGSREDHDVSAGLTADNLTKCLERLLSNESK